MIRPQVRVIPQPALALRRAKANLEHVAQTIGLVEPTAVPDSHVGKKQSSSRADNVLLPADVLVPRYRRLADNP